MECVDSDLNQHGSAVQVADSQRMWQFTEGDGFLLRSPEHWNRTGVRGDFRTISRR